MKKVTLFFVVVLSAVVISQGCVNSRTTTRESAVTKTTAKDQSMQENKGNFPQGSSNLAEQGTVRTIEKTTQVKQERVTDESGGVLSTTIHFIGKVIALPFKIIADIIEAIF